MKHAYRVISLILLFLTTVSVRAETLDCTPITSLPTVITTQGIYCLTGNLSTNMSSGKAITINTNNVTIDLNGYKLGGLGAGDGTNTTGIYASGRKNITIKNGIIRGFFQGIRLYDSSPYTTSAGHTIKNILADQNTYSGIEVRGLGNTVSHNTVVDTGGSLAFTSGFGIIVYGSSSKITDNDVSTTTETSYAYGIYLRNANFSLVNNNTVTDTITDTGTSYAIRIQDSTGVFLRNNNLANADYGLYFLNSNGKYFNNLTFNVITPFTGGISIGSNNN